MMRERKPLEVVSIFDPALDKSMDVLAYAGTQSAQGDRDPALIKLKPGMQAVRFTVQALTRRQNDAVEARGPVEMRNGALAFGLIAVVVPGAAEAMRPSTEVPDEHGGQIAIWDEKGLDWLEETVGRDVMGEIATVILHLKGGLGNAFGGSGARRFWLPPQLWAELGRRDRQSAA